MARFLGSLLLLALAGCGGSTLQRLKTPDNLTLYSIDGKETERREAENTAIDGAHSFHGYLVLGQLDVTDREQKRQLVAALKDGIDRKGIKANACFWPRHGLHIEQKGVVADYIICFECNQYDEIMGNKRRRGTISADVQPVFDAPLTAAAIPLGPK
jgi:hypothetical protein